jgi:lysophospholipid acyltransferase (LPLAT)-like uncharacterized protein
MRTSLGAMARLLFRTWSMNGRLEDGKELAARDYGFGSEIFALSERDALALAGVIVDRGFTVLVSHGRDGDLASAALTGIGCSVVRGAAKRGGVLALRRLIRDLKGSDRPAGIVVDGPLGPVGHPKRGVLLLARETGRRIVPLGAAAGRRLEIPKTWSGLYVPAPFATVAIVCGRSICVPGNATARDLDALAEELHRSLADAREQAAAWAGAPGSSRPARPRSSSDPRLA